MEKVKFNNLSGWLKTAIVLTWIIIGIYGLSFLVGFIIGLISELPL